MLVIKSFRKPIVIIMIMYRYVNYVLHLDTICSFFLQQSSHCFYHGSLRGFQHSIVALSTCDGIRYALLFLIRLSESDRILCLMFWYILSHRELEVIIISDCWPGTNASRLLLFIKTWTQGFSKINEQIITKTHYNMYHYRISMSSYRESVSVG